MLKPQNNVRTFKNRFAILDGHNDLLTRLWLSDHPDPIAEFFKTRVNGHLDLPRCRQAGLCGGLFAIFLPPFSYIKQHHPEKLHDPHAHEFSQQEIEQICLQQLDLAQQLIQRSDAQIQLCTTVADIQQSKIEQKIALILHMEGAESLQDNPDLFDHFYVQGLRSIGPLWNRPSRFGHGLNSPFPHRPNPNRSSANGLTQAGQLFIKRCEQKHMVIDVSHMNEDAFWDTTELIHQPLVATHSNIHALCPQARNLTDQQLYAIRDSRGMIGINFDVAFLRADGQRNIDTPLDLILDHAEYVMDLLGEQYVGFGSDFDGALLSRDLKDVTGMLKLIECMQHRNYSAELIEGLCHQNWMDVLARIWKK